MNRWRMTSGRQGDSTTFQNRVALELTLLTFCPPGPLLLEKLHSNSLSGIERVAVITGITRYSNRHIQGVNVGSRRCNLF